MENPGLKYRSIVLESHYFQISSWPSKIRSMLTRVGVSVRERVCERERQKEYESQRESRRAQEEKMRLVFGQH